MTPITLWDQLLVVTAYQSIVVENEADIFFCFRQALIHMHFVFCTFKAMWLSSDHAEVWQIVYKCQGAGTAQSVVCWACCPA